MMAFADRSTSYIISPDVGIEFDYVEEAFNYYNLYSWERGFGIKWGKERIANNRESHKLPIEKRYKLGRELNCCCSVSTKNETGLHMMLIAIFLFFCVYDLHHVYDLQRAYVLLLMGGTLIYVQGRPATDVKTSSIRTQCPAKLRLARTSDHGWIVVEHTAEHNHELVGSYGESRQWPSHQQLDKYTQSLVRKLRENNIGITKLYNIL
jgi:hypothetical protein